MSESALLLQRPLCKPRVWFVAPGEPRDRRTLERLCEAAIRDVAEALLSDRGSQQLLEAIGRRGKEGLIRGLERRIAQRIAFVLASQKTRQPVKHAFVEYRCVPVPSENRCDGVIVVRAWSHTYRTTFSPEIMK